MPAREKKGGDEILLNVVATLQTRCPGNSSDRRGDENKEKGGDEILLHIAHTSLLNAFAALRT